MSILFISLRDWYKSPRQKNKQIQESRIDQLLTILMLTESLKFNERHAPYAVVPVATKNAPQLNESHSEPWIKNNQFEHTDLLYMIVI